MSEVVITHEDGSLHLITQLLSLAVAPLLFTSVFIEVWVVHVECPLNFG